MKIEFDEICDLSSVSSLLLSLPSVFSLAAALLDSAPLAVLFGFADDEQPKALSPILSPSARCVF